MVPMSLKKLAAAVGAVLAVASAGAHAQAFPSKTVTMVMPIAASTAYYIVMRQMADQIQAKTGASIVFDVALGASGTLGPARVKRSEADGHTVGLTWAAPMTLNPLFAKDAQYDPVKDFAYVMMLTQHGIFWAGRVGFGPNNLAETVALAKAKPDTVRIGYAGTGSLLGILEIEEASGVKFLKVPYKTSGQFDAALLGGEIDIGLTTAGTALAQIKAGKLKGIVIGSRKRSSLHPNVGSMAEVYPNVESGSWYAIYAPAGTPADRLAWQYREWSAALKDPKIAERMEQGFGYEVIAAPGQAVMDQVKREIDSNQRIVRKYNISE